MMTSTQNGQKNRSAVVTGAGSGLGRDIALGLAAKGYRVLGTAISLDEIPDLKKASGVPGAMSSDACLLNPQCRKGRIVMRMLTSSAIVFLLLNVVLSKAEEPKRDTLRAWDDYVDVVNTGVAQRNAGSRPFLWVDESPAAQRRVQDGELVITKNDPRKVPQGLIHHWVGGMFVPNVSLDQVMRVLNNYDRYSAMYKPLIRRTAVVERNGDTVKLNVLAVQKAFSVTAAVETDEDIQIARPTLNRVCITANSVRIQEIADYGKSSEHAFPETRRPGYVWRALIVERLEQRDGGVYVELETISLSRGIPIEVRWLIKPLTDDLPRKMMTDLLDETRAAVQGSVAGPR